MSRQMDWDCVQKRRMKMMSRVCMGNMRGATLEMHANRASSREMVETTVHFVQNFWMPREGIHRLHGQDKMVKLSLLDMEVGQRHLLRPLSP